MGLLSAMIGCQDSSTPSTINQNTSPEVHINSPLEGSIYRVGDIIIFTGSSTDSEDGDLYDSALIWSSDIDGQIGTGETFTSDALTPGIQKIVLSATDSEGAVGSDKLTIFVSTCSLKDTGQSKSFTNIFGEDADYTINPPIYTKLDADGNELPPDAPNWSMVRDEVAMLIWEVKTDDGGIHDKDRYYNWQDSQDFFVTIINNENFGGYSDWRLPTIKELSLLIQPDKITVSIDEGYFPNTLANVFNNTTPYWSSTINNRYSDGAWQVNFSLPGVVIKPDIVSDGSVGIFSRTTSALVRAVRGEKNISALLDNDDGTVTDAASGLMWKQTETETMTWEEALVYCENLDFAGYKDWRLPNRNELHSIADYTVYSPSIDATAFPDIMLSNYWTSTTFARNQLAAWGIDFDNGYIRQFSKKNGLYVRAVRSGCN